MSAERPHGKHCSWERLYSDASGHFLRNPQKNSVLLVTAVGCRGLLSMRETENTTALLTIREIATILQCSKTHVARLLDGRVRGADPISHIRLGRRKVVRRLTFDRWLQASESSPTANSRQSLNQMEDHAVEDRR